MRKKSIIILFLLVIPIIGYFFFSVYAEKSIGYNLGKIKNGTNQEKYIAIENLAKNNVKIAIPLIAKELNNNELILYKGKTPEEVNCFATLALGDLTGLDYGDSCCCDYGDKTKVGIINDWQKWYNEEYVNWIVNN